MKFLWLWIVVVFSSDPRPSDAKLTNGFTVVRLTIPFFVEDFNFEARHCEAGFRDVLELLVFAQSLLCVLRTFPRQRAQWIGFGHSPALNHLDAEFIPIPAHHRDRRSRAATGQARKFAEIEFSVRRLDRCLYALPDSRHACGYCHALVVHQFEECIGRHKSVWHDMFAAQHRRIKGQAPTHRMEHRHNAQE